MSSAKVVLKKPLREAICAGHPWVYRDALVFSPNPGLVTGTVVDVVDPAGLVARGLYDADSPIAVRIYTLDPETHVGADLLALRLAEALSLRRQVLDFATTDAFRLVHGEGDLLPGVVVDLYGRVAVVRFDGQAAQVFRPHLPAALLALGLPIQTVYERTPGREAQLLWGSLPGGEVPIREHGMRLLVDVAQGQKTGLFLDQRENRLLVRSIVKPGMRVWNGFSYTGGFSLAAALAGGTVVSVDLAAQALSTARRIFGENGLQESAHSFVAEDVFVNLRKAIALSLVYDLVIVDPPSFAPSEKALPKALRGYRDLFASACRIVGKGGLFAAASCSSHVTLEAFLQVLAEATSQAGRAGRILEIRGQPADHPTLPAFPEGRYLKFVLLRLS